MHAGKFRKNSTLQQCFLQPIDPKLKFYFETGRNCIQKSRLSSLTINVIFQQKINKMAATQSLKKCDKLIAKFQNLLHD